MADDRPVGDVVAELAALKRVVEDMRTTLMARSSRMPTGMFMGTWLAVAPPDTLLLDGSVVSRAGFPVLWQHVQSNSLLTAGLFTAGDGSSTFGLPDWRGKVLRGKAAAEAVGQQVGSDSINLSSGQLPSHSHPFTTDYQGNHGGHFPTGITYAQAQANALGLAAWNSSGSDSGSHNHSGTTGSTGSGQAVDIRQASVAINWLVWT